MIQGVENLQTLQSIEWHYTMNGKTFNSLKSIQVVLFRVLKDNTRKRGQEYENKKKTKTKKRGKESNKRDCKRYSINRISMFMECQPIKSREY